MFIEYTEECYGCKDYGTKECDKCFEKKCALTEIEAERKENINLTSKEIANDCQGILDMLNNDEE